MTKSIKYIVIFLMLATIITCVAEAKSSFSSDRLKNACAEYLKSKLEGDFEFDIAVPDSRNFSEDGIKARVVSGENLLRGRRSLTIEFLRGSAVISSQNVPISVKYFAETVTAARPVRRGSVLTEADLKIERKDVTAYKADELIDISSAVGKTVSVNITTGTIIGAALLEKEKTVRRGSKVSVIAESGSVVIRTTGESMQDGSTGDIIKFKRDGSREIFRGKVLQDGSILVTANQ